jgi:hypothetical protein
MSPCVGGRLAADEQDSPRNLGFLPEYDLDSRAPGITLVPAFPASPSPSHSLPHSLDTFVFFHSLLILRCRAKCCRFNQLTRSCAFLSSSLLPSSLSPFGFSGMALHVYTTQESNIKGAALSSKEGGVCVPHFRPSSCSLRLPALHSCTGLPAQVPIFHPRPLLILS